MRLREFKVFVRITIAYAVNLFCEINAQRLDLAMTSISKSKAVLFIRLPFNRCPWLYRIAVVQEQLQIMKAPVETKIVQRTELPLCECLHRLRVIFCVDQFLQWCMFI